MTNEIIYRGLRLSSGKCRYFNVKAGSVDSLVEDPVSSTLTLTYSPGSSAKSLSLSLGIPLIGSGGQSMLPTGSPVKFKKVTISLNGLILEKLTYDPHTVNIIVVKDSESRVVQNYNRTTIVVSENDRDNQEFVKFLFYSGGLLYLKPIGPKLSSYHIKNFPKVILGKENLTLTSDNNTVYTLRRNYNDYVIREIDYQDQFILELRKRLDSYGVQLVRLNKEQTLNIPTYITYQFNQTPINQGHPWRRDPDSNVMNHKQPVDFVFHTTDMVLYHDFKNKYQNVDMVTNFTEYKTTDRYGDRWTAAVKWGQITEDFNHTYQPDDNSNFAFQCQFRCELFFYEVLDTRYEFLKEIILTLDMENQSGEVEIREHDHI